MPYLTLVLAVCPRTCVPSFAPPSQQTSWLAAVGGSSGTCVHRPPLHPYQHHQHPHLWALSSSCSVQGSEVMALTDRCRSLTFLEALVAGCSDLVVSCFSSPSPSPSLSEGSGTPASSAAIFHSNYTTRLCVGGESRTWNVNFRKRGGAGFQVA